jgi:hypothetical protein
MLFICMLLTPLGRRGVASRSTGTRGGGILALEPHPPLLRELLGEPAERVGIAPFLGHGLVLPRLDVDPGHPLGQHALPDCDERMHVLWCGGGTVDRAVLDAEVAAVAV